MGKLKFYACTYLYLIDICKLFNRNFSKLNYKQSLMDILLCNNEEKLWTPIQLVYSYILLAIYTKLIILRN